MQRERETNPRPIAGEIKRKIPPFLRNLEFAIKLTSTNRGNFNSRRETARDRVAAVKTLSGFFSIINKLFEAIISRTPCFLPSIS